jgi:hypothetical protein
MLERFRREKGLDTEKPTATELKSYLSEPTCDFSTKTMEYWKSKSKIFPHLSRIAKDFLATQPTSVPAESSSGLTVSELRTKLHTETVMN